MKRKLLAAILAGVMVLCLLPTSFSYVATAEEAEPIRDRDGLKSISGGGSYRLTADIDLEGAEWTPLGEFTGKLDGGGHVIRNLSITDTDQDGNGLFASIGAGGEVFDLGIEDINITAGDNTGGIAGTNSGDIYRCYTTGTVSGGEYVGGIAGTNTGVIENCYSRAAVNGTDYLGGLAGSSSGSIKTSYAASAVTDSVMNRYLQFDNNGYVEISHKDAYSNNNAFTLEAWFQWDGIETSGDNVDFIFGKGLEQFEIHTEGGSGENGLRFIPVPDGDIESDGSYAGDSYIDVHEVLDSDWFHVAAVYRYDSASEKAYAKVYVNGVAQELWQKPSAEGIAESVGNEAMLSRTDNPLASNEQDINIGRRTDESLYFDGKIADVRFWNTARTGDEIEDNMNKVLTGNEAGLVGYWRLNEASGDAIDSSPTRNDGELKGNVTRVTAQGTAEHKGALAGFGEAENCFFDSTHYGSESGGAGTAEITSKMKAQGIYNGWDFSTTWKMSSDDGYPCFRARSAVTVHSGTTDKPIAVEGETVTITADKLSGRRFKEWTGVDELTFTDSTDAESSVAKFTMPASPVAVTATYEAIPDAPPSSDSDESDAAPAGKTVYNDPDIPQATIWLTGKGFAANDRLITEKLTSGERYNAMLRLAEGGEVLNVYNIYLQSGMKSTGSAMHITFDLSASYAGQKFTLVHEKSNGTYEYFYAAADSDGDLTFGPLYSLSPFMLVKGTVASEINPETGYSSERALWMGMLMVGTVLTARYAIAKRKVS